MRPLALLLLAVASLPGATWYVTISGLGGEPDYEQRFKMWAHEIDTILKTGGPDAHVDTLEAATKAVVRTTLDRVAQETKPQDALVVMLIGHGTFDGFDYKINLPGPDLSAIELAGLLDRVPAGRQLVVNMTSSSGGAIDVLRKANRVVISATKTGTEKNATVFARYWVEALRDPAADADKNESVSALEAFQYADRKTVSFYESNKRLATEHAVLEDTGKAEAVRAPSSENGEGLLASTFAVVRLGSAATAAKNPAKATLLAKKESIEQAIDKLKYEKTLLSPEEYKKQLGALLLELSRTQEELEK
jgi:hypothetical protein